MKKLYTFFYLILFPCFIFLSPAYGSMPDNGMSKKDTLIYGGYVSGQWTPEYNYIIKGDIEIFGYPNFSDTLEILPGVSVFFDGDVTFTVHGILKANGEKSAPISFTPYGSLPWYGIRFESCPSPEIEYCIFEGTRENQLFNEYGALRYNDVSPVNPVNNCQFINNAGGCIYISEFNTLQTIEIKNNVFSDVQQFGVKIINGNITGSLAMSGNRFTCSATSGDHIGLYMKFCDCALLNSQSNYYEGFYTDTDDQTGCAMTIITNNTLNVSLDHDSIVSNRGIGVGGIRIGQCNDFTAVQCYFDQNQGQERAALSANCNTVTLQDNLFSGNRNLSGYFGGGAVMLQGPAVSGSSDDIVLTGNTFINNLCSGSLFHGGAIHITSSQPVSSIVLSNQNQFVNNEVQGKGGSIYIECPSVNTVTLQDLILRDSTKAREGGFLYLTCSDLGQLTISNINVNNEKILCRATSGDGGFATVICQSHLNNLSFSSNHFSASVATMNGGCLSVTSPRINVMSITGNVLDSCMAGLSGGFLALDAGHMTTFSLNQNTAAIKSGAGMNGGFCFARGNHFNTMHIEGNNFVAATAGSNGGFTCLEVDTTGYLSLKNNTSQQSKATNGDGGYIYINGTILAQLSMTDNDITLNASAQQGAVGYFNALNSIGEFDFSGNSFGDNTAASSGGILFMNTATCGPVSIRNNMVTGHARAAGGDGGFLYLETGSCTSLTLDSNTVSDTAYAHGSGGMFFFTTGAAVSTVTCDHNQVSHAVAAEGSGGVISFAAPAADFFSFSGNEATLSSTAGGHGGALFLETTGNASTITIQDNVAGSCSTDDGDGGFASLNIGGSVPEMLISNNTITAAGAHASGGTFYVEVSHIIGDALFQENTVTSGSAASNGYGGTVMLSADSCRNLSFLDNIVGGSSVASLAGGMIYLETNKRMDTLDITGNTCHDTRCNGGDGGMVYITLPSLGQIHFQQNTVTGVSTASGNGGCLSLDVSGTLGELFVFDNEAGSSTATGGNGGFISMQSDSCHTVFLSDNRISQTARAAQNGGVLFLETNKKIGTLTLTGNITGSVQATTGNGGWGCFTVPSIGSVDFLQNAINSSATAGQNGGCLYVSIPGSVDSVLLMSNQTGACQAQAGDGGLLYLKTGNKPAVIRMSDNTIKAAGAPGGSGGVAYISLPAAALVQLSDNTLTDSTKVLHDGGYLFLSVDGDADTITLSSNITGKSLAASGNGGYACILAGGTLGRLELAGNSCGISRAGGSGGYLNLETGHIGSLLCHNEVISEQSTAQNGSGGYLNIVNSGQVNSIDYTMNDIASSHAGTNGGMIALMTGQAGALAIHGNENGSNPFGNASAAHDGGAIYIDCQSEITQFSLAHNVFHNTTCGGAGGAVFIRYGAGGGTSGVSVTDNIFNDPATIITPVSGGGLYADHIHKLLITDCVFENLLADSLGGALAIVSVDSLAVASGNSFIHNSAGLMAGTPAVNEARGGAGYFNDIGHLLISGNEFKGNATTLLGGAVSCENITAGSVTGNTFLNNSVITGGGPQITKGGGLYTVLAGMMHAGQNIFAGNDAMQGGAVYLDHSGVLIDGNTISNNGGIGEIITIDGGGVFVNESHGILAHNTITSNAVQNSGGGIYFRQSGPPGTETMTASDNFIFGNRARLGGGIFSENMPVVLIRDHISRNECSNSAFSNLNNGGGVCLTGWAASSTLYNCIIYKNIIASDQNRGSGIYIDPTGTDGTDSTHIVNCTLYENNFYGLYLKVVESQQTDRCEALNTIMYCNNTLQDGGRTFDEQQANFDNPDIVTDYSLICPLPEYPHGDSVFCASPGFRNYSVYPVSTAACVNKGNPSASYNDVLFPPSYYPERNDIGVTGGPYAFGDTAALYLNPLPALTALFTVTDEACQTYTFKPKIFLPEATYLWIIDDNIYSNNYNPQTGIFIYEFQTTGQHQVCLYAEETVQNTTVSDQTCMTLYLPSYPPVVDMPSVCDHSPYVVLQNDTLYVKQSHFDYSPTVRLCASFTVPAADKDYYYSSWASLPPEAVTVNAFTDTTLDLTLLPGIVNFPGLPVIFNVNSTTGCPVTTTSYIMKVVAINDVGIAVPDDHSLRLNISPNPAWETARFELTGHLTGKIVIYLYSPDNKCRFQKTWIKNDLILQERLDLKNFSPGLYIGIIRSGAVELHFKLVII